MLEAIVFGLLGVGMWAFLVWRCARAVAEILNGMDEHLW